MLVGVPTVDGGTFVRPLNNANDSCNGEETLINVLTNHRGNTTKP